MPLSQEMQAGIRQRDESVLDALSHGSFNPWSRVAFCGRPREAAIAAGEVRADDPRMINCESCRNIILGSWELESARTVTP